MKASADPRSHVDLELDVLARWRELDIAGETRRRRTGAPIRVIWEPAGAAGPADPDILPARVLADAFARYATMRGWDVERRNARDCHAPGIELAVARELGLDSKAHVECHGIGDLNARCRASALARAAQRDALAERVAVQASPGSLTLDRRYVESVWWAVKEVADAGLLYEGVKVVAHCPRCDTALGDDEIAQLAVVDPAACVRITVARDGGPLQSGDELLVWSPAAWTLAANAAVAVDPELTYVRAKTGALDAPVVVAEALAERVLGDLAGVRILERFRGAAIDGVRYEPPFRYLPAAAFGERGHTILLAGFVTASEGTGLLSTTTAFDEDDRALGARFGLGVVNPVAADGTFDERMGRYAGRDVRAAEAGLVADLRTRGRLLSAEPREHDAPHCGHCATRLLDHAKASWYVATAQLRDELRSAGANITWRRPQSADRLLSRERYWGVPLPVWRCARGHVTVVGSLDELGQRSGTRVEDPHRPYVDDIELRCECGEPATRVADLVHPWFEAGAMPFARRHEPFAGELTLDELYPADLACDGRPHDWLASLLTVSALLRGGEPVVERVVRAGPCEAPGDIVERLGADALRWHVLAGEPATIFEALCDAYALAAEHPPGGPGAAPAHPRGAPGATAEHARGAPAAIPADAPLAELDRWIASRLSATIEAAGARLDAYDAPGAARAIVAFAQELCESWVPSCDARLRAGDHGARRTLHRCLVTLAQLLAPLTPLLADEIYTGLDGSEPSVHLTDWPAVQPRDLELEAAIGLARGA